MEIIKKIDKMIIQLLKPIPHLPTSTRKWLADNIWWVTLAGVVLAAMGIINIIGGMFAAMSFMDTPWGYYARPVYDAVIVLNLVALLPFMIATVILMAMAVKPLKFAKREGWTLLFWVIILRTLAMLVGAVLTFSVFGFINNVVFGLVGVAICTYLLYEIRSYFIVVSKSKAKAIEK